MKERSSTVRGTGGPLRPWAPPRKSLVDDEHAHQLADGDRRHAEIVAGQAQRRHADDGGQQDAHQRMPSGAPRIGGRPNWVRRRRPNRRRSRRTRRDRPRPGRHSRRRCSRPRRRSRPAGPARPCRCRPASRRAAADRPRRKAPARDQQSRAPAHALPIRPCGRNHSTSTNRP